MLAWRAAKTAARSRGLALGSGKPERAAVVSSRMILVKTLARFLSCAPFRYMMFLNCEWPAISAAPLSRGLTSQYGRIGAARAQSAAYARAWHRQGIGHNAPPPPPPHA